MTEQTHDPLLEAWAERIEEALGIGTFTAWDEVPDVVISACVLLDRIRELGSDDPLEAEKLLQVMIGGCYEKLHNQDLDDSSGRFGDLVATLFAEWVGMRQARGAEPTETANTLLSWMDHDPWGIFQAGRERILEAHDAQGLEALEDAVRRRWSDDAGEDRGRKRDAEAILKHIYAARDDAEAYRALVEASGPPSAANLKQLALIHERTGDLERALSSLEQAIHVAKDQRGGNRRAGELTELRGRVLARMGRTEEAVQYAWEDFHRSPSPSSHRRLLLVVPDEERSQWSRRAAELAETSATGSLEGRLSLLLELEEDERLLRVSKATPEDELATLPPEQLERAAKTLSSRRGDACAGARLYRIGATSILRSRKTEQYPWALRLLMHTRDILGREGCHEDWEGIVQDVREGHGRKSAFMPSFEVLAEGGSLVEMGLEKPPFLEVAQTRWEAGARGEHARGPEGASA